MTGFRVPDPPVEPEMVFVDHTLNVMEGKRLITEEMVREMFPDRDRFAHKGNFGHALVVAGKQGMMGAAILAVGAALRSGCGLVTAHIPFSERLAVQITHPSAMVGLDKGTCFSCLPENLEKYSAIGVGPGLGQSPETVKALGLLLKTGKPAVIDADALNIIASHPEYFSLIPESSILTPHIGELRRLLASAMAVGLIPALPGAALPGAGGDPAGKPLWSSYDEMTGSVRALSAAIRSVTVVKGAETMICPPSGDLVFNPTGNPGMAKGGSGDILTGLVTGFRARGFSPENAAIAGVFLHGLAGDLAASSSNRETMTSSDLLSFIPPAFTAIIH